MLVKILRWWYTLYIDWIWYEMLMKWYCCVMWCMVNISFYLLIESPAHPLAFFSRYCTFWRKGKEHCIAIEVLRSGQWNMSIFASLSLFICGKVLPCNALKAFVYMIGICLVYVMNMWCIFWFISGICIGIWICIFVKMFWKKYMV